MNLPAPSADTDASKPDAAGEEDEEIEYDDFGEPGVRSTTDNSANETVATPKFLTQVGLSDVSGAHQMCRCWFTVSIQTPCLCFEHHVHRCDMLCSHGFVFSTFSSVVKSKKKKKSKKAKKRKRSAR